MAGAPDPVASTRPSSVGHELQPLTGHRADIQALRGLAVLLVVLYHAQVVVSGGFIGVDVFFVISGFVIGRVILAGFESKGSLSFGTFYTRRVRRLLPALAITLSAVMLLAPLLAPAGAGRLTSTTGIAAALFSANIYLYKATDLGYFDTAAELNPLLHTWSLSVEEQFYFAIPALLLLVWRIGIRRRDPITALRWFVAVLIISSLALCVVASDSASFGPLDGVRFAFFAPVTRAWEFAVGLALVLLPAAAFRRRWLQPVALVCGLALVAAAAILFDDATVFPGSAALVPVTGTALIVFAATELGAPEDFRKVRGLAPMVRLGDLSYSWYLWHWPLIVFAGAHWPNSGRLPLVAAAALSLVPAAASQRWVEQRFRATGATKGRSTLLLTTVCILVPVGIGLVTRPLSSRLVEGTEYTERSEDHLGRASCHDNNERVLHPERCLFGGTGDGTKVMLVGDSNAGHLTETLVGAAEANDTPIYVATKSGCPFLDIERVDAGTPNDLCSEEFAESRALIREQAPDILVISNSTDTYLERDTVTLRDPVTGRLVDSPEDKADAVEVALQQTIEDVAADGTRVVLIEVLPKPLSAGSEFDPAECSPLRLRTGSDVCGFSDFEVSDSLTVTANQVEQRAAASAGATTWNYAKELCPAGRCSESAGTPLWRDSNHISVAAAELLIPAATDDLRQVLDEVRRQS